MMVALAAAAAAVVTFRDRGTDVARLLRIDPNDPVAALTLRPIAVGEGMEPEAKTRLRRQLVQAGYRKPSAPEVFVASKGLLALAGLGLIVVAHTLRSAPISNAPQLALLATGT